MPDSYQLKNKVYFDYPEIVYQLLSGNEQNFTIDLQCVNFLHDCKFTMHRPTFLDVVEKC